MSIYVNQNPQFCVYLTIYSGNKLPPFYIGSTSIVKIKNGYHGSVLSKKYKNIWEQELKENPHLFKTIIIEKFYSKKNAVYNERLLQIQFDVVKSNHFINMSLAKHNGMFGISNKGIKKPELSKKMSGENNHFYGKKHSTETIILMEIKGKGKNKGIKNCKFEGYLVTPFGTFESIRNILIENLTPKKAGKYCKKSNTVITRHMYFASKFFTSNYDKTIIGKTLNELGFDFIKA